MIYKSGKVARVFDYALDKNRTMAYHDWIQANVNGKVVCELGGGSGIMAWLCIKYGASKVYVYENNVRIINWLEELFDGESKVEIKKEDVTSATFPTADFYIHENIASNVYMENILGMYTNLKSQNLEDKTYPNKIKIQHGTYTGTSVESDFDKDDFSNANVLEFFNSCPLDRIPSTGFKLRTPETSKITMTATVFDGDIKDLTRVSEEDTNSEYLFWEATFDGSHEISNYKNKTHWNIIKAGDTALDIPSGVTYDLG